MQRINCKNCGHSKQVSSNWFDPPDFDMTENIWTQEYICPKCKTVHTIECEYSIAFEILDVQVDEVGDE